ncbi:MAG: hypothetical protein JWM33_566 [Caulobacteraceae bacterium]|nr:hypothetical protein [Caulobacteraceae bacterium]
MGVRVNPGAAALLLLIGMISVSAGVAQAAASPGPATLPGEVIGVVGSGDKLSLRIKAGKEARTLSVGDLYLDGWKLTALTDSTATLARNNEIQTVGLNPTGAVAKAKADGPASSVKTLAGLDLAKRGAEARAQQPAFSQLIKDQLGPWDGKTARMGLSLAETQRYVDYQKRGALFQASASDPQGPRGPNGFLDAAQVEALGADAGDFRALNQKVLDALQASRGITKGPTMMTTLSPTGEPRTPVSDPVMLQVTQFLIESNLSSVMIPPAP